MTELQILAGRLREEPPTQALALEAADALDAAARELQRFKTLPAQIAAALMQASEEPPRRNRFS